MAILLMRTQRIWVSLLYISSLRLLCAATETKDNCDCMDKQLTEMKIMMSLLDSKISSIDVKLSNINVLEYAFKTNTIDENIKTLNARVDQMARQMDSIKESLTVLPSSPCPQTEKIQRIQNTRTSPASDQDLSLKLDDYGKKVLQFHREIKAASDEHQKSLTGFFEVVRSGFAKVIAKVESLLGLEGRMSTLQPLVRQISMTTELVSTQVLNIQTDVTELSGNVAGLIDSSKTFTEVVNELKSTTSFPVSQLGQAVEVAKELQSEMDRLATVEQHVIQAASLSQRLWTKDSIKVLPAEDRETAQNLKTSLSNVENASLPLFLSMQYTFENMNAIIKDAFTTLANKTQCRADNTIKLEIAKLKKDIVKEKPRDLSNSKEVFAYCGDTIQNLVDTKTPDLKIPLLKLLSHLNILVDENRKSERSGSDLGNWDKPFRSLLG